MEKIRGFEVVSDWARKNEEVYMPVRKTKYSAGYDFLAPFDIKITPGTEYFFWSDIKAYMLGDEVLALYPRASTGIKKNIMLKNTVGIIDADYYKNKKNDGNIGFSLYNYGDTPAIFEAGQGVAQAIFQKYLIADNCNTDEVRKGGIGSTNG